MRKAKIHNSSLLLLQGSLLTMLSVFILLRPQQEDFGDLINVTGMFCIWYGGACLFKFFFGEDHGRILPDFFTGIILIALGPVLFQDNTGQQGWHMKALVGLFLIISIQVFITAMDLTYVFKWWKLSIPVVVVSIMVALVLLSGERVLNVPLYVMGGFQISVLGCLMIWLSLLDKSIEMEYHKTLRELKDGK